MSLSVKNRIVTVTQRYMEQRTPTREEYLSELAFLGRLMGNIMKNEKMMPQNL